MATQVKIKVSIPQLIEAIEAKKAELAARHKEAMAEHPAKLAEWKAESLALLNAAIADVKKGQEPKTGLRYPRDEWAIKSPPQKPVLNTGTYDYRLAALKMSTEDSIALSREDFTGYVS